MDFFLFFTTLVQRLQGIFALCALVFGLSYASTLFADADQLMRSLLYLEELKDRELVIPTTYNHLLQGGYWNMPSARMGCMGEIGAGAANVPPYCIASLRLQVLSHFEITGNYRLFRGVPDPILSQYGYGDLSERGINVKFTLWNPEEHDYRLPAIAIGCDDLAGTKGFKGRYIVATQVLPNLGLEMSLGYGQQRYKGLFGGFLWMPYSIFKDSCSERMKRLLRPLCIGAEYDATHYRDPKCEPHPQGREVKSHVNFGCKYRLWDCVDLSLSYVRGKELAVACNVVWNMGNNREWLIKMEDPLPCTTFRECDFEPCDQALSPLLVQEFATTLSQQGFSLLKADVEFCDCERTLRCVVTNDRYYWESDVQFRLQALFRALEFPQIDHFVVVIEEDGFSIQEYRFTAQMLDWYRNGTINRLVFSYLAPLKEVSAPCGSYERVFSTKRHFFDPFIDPKTLFLFGSAGGKWKYAVGVSFGAQGFLPGDLSYALSIGYLGLSTIPRDSCCDCLNPSKLPNVLTDELLYVRKGKLTLDEAFLQKNINAGWGGHFFRAATGLFDVMYGGVVAEWLYFPVQSPWAIGAEASYLRKRIPGRSRFTNRIRECRNGEPTWIKFPLYQLFFDVYYHWFDADVDAQVTFGHFLAGDIGARFAISHSYPSGFRVTAWYTPTNAHDRINGSTYFDTGIGFTMPLDLFYTCSSRKEWGSGLSPWLRDCGVRRMLGNPLYPTLRAARR